MENGRKVRDELEMAKQQLVDLGTLGGIQMSKLEGISKHTARAWAWVQKNQDAFEERDLWPSGHHLFYQ